MEILVDKIDFIDTIVLAANCPECKKLAMVRYFQDRNKEFIIDKYGGCKQIAHFDLPEHDMRLILPQYPTSARLDCGHHLYVKKIFPLKTNRLKGG